MDARLRLNQMRRNKQRGNNRGQNQRGRVTDLRQLIASKDKKITKLKDRPNSVKNRIGYKSKSNLQKQKLNELKTKELKKQTSVWTKNKRVSLSEDKGIPKIMVDLTKIPDNSAKTPKASVSNSNQVWNSSSIPKTEQKNTVLVSNLNKTITETDIKELFGDIGPLVSAAKINTSVAVVVYRSISDARNACQTYHNRLLDGMPMQCNILFHPNEEYVIESPPKRLQSETYSNLLATQLRQINDIPLRGETSSRRLYQ